MLAGCGAKARLAAAGTKPSRPESPIPRNLFGLADRRSKGEVSTGHRIQSTVAHTRRMVAHAVTLIGLDFLNEIDPC